MRICLDSDCRFCDSMSDEAVMIGSRGVDDSG